MAGAWRGARGCALIRLSLRDLSRCGVRITGGFSSGAATGNSNDEASPISIGMVAAGGCLDRPGHVVGFRIGVAALGRQVGDLGLGGSRCGLSRRGARFG